MAEKDSKKRKRQSNVAETPHKKVAIDSAKVKVLHKDHDDNSLHPVLLSTPGVKAPNVSFNAYSKPKSSKNSTASIRPNTHHLLLHSSKHPQLDYTATSASSNDHLTHYLAVFDPQSGTLQVAPAHHVTLRSTLRSEAQEMEQNQGRLTYAQQREELGREFGTKKAKKAIASRSENAITSDAKGKGAITDVQTAILESVGEATSNLASKLSEKDKANAALAAKPIPRPNLDAESPEDVYTFDTLIPPSDARLIKVKEWMEQDRDTLGLMHSYPHDRHPAAASYGDSRRMQALRYLTLLLEFHDALGNAGKSTRKVPKKELLQKKLPPSRWAPELVDSVRRRFTNDSGQELGKWQTDNLYTHICALALYIDHWECEMFMLKDDLKLEIRQISQYFSELGARVNAPTEAERNRRNFSKAQANATRIAKLKLPLDFPKVRMARRV